MNKNQQIHAGGCHCGKVRFQVRLDLSQPASRCNCTFCTKSGGASLMVAPAAFELVAGADVLAVYHRDGSPVQHPFCRVCGIRSFGTGDIPELGGRYVAVNVNCLDDVDPAELRYQYWDGRHDNWHAGLRDQPWPVHVRAA